MGSAGHLPELVHDRRDVLPVRSADVHHEVRLVDVQRRPGLAGAVQQQELCRSFRLLEVRYVGHHRGAGLPERVRRQPDRDGHHVLHHHPAQDPVLHGQLDPADGTDFVPLRACVLPACRSRRKGDARYQYSAVTGCVPVAGVEDSAADLARTATDCQVFAVHLHHEHRLHPGHRHHHQLELPWAAHAPHAHVDPVRVPALPAGHAAHEAPPEDAAPLDDGDARHEHAPAAAHPPLVRLAGRSAQTHQRARRQAVQDGRDGAVRPAPPELQDEPQDEQRRHRAGRGLVPPGKRKFRLDPAVAGGEQGHRGGRVHRGTSAQRGSVHSGESPKSDVLPLLQLS